MKILFFINKLYGGGAERVASILMNHLSEKHNVCAVVFDNNAKSYQISDQITIHKITVDEQFRITRLVKRIRKIKEEIKFESPDIIISFLTPINIYVLTSNLFLRRKIIISERNTLNRVQSKFVRIVRRIIYPIADKIVFVTKADCCKFGQPHNSVTIYNPAILTPCTNYDNRQKTVITIAPTDRWYNKGLDLLIESWGKITERNPDWTLEIYGRNSIAHLPSAITQQEKISWKGWRDDIAEVLRTKSIFVLASRFEGCPNSLIEAMSQGCACIGTDCEGGIKEIITNGVDGLIAESENIDDIAEKLQLLIDNENIRRELSAGAIEKIKQFDTNGFYAKWDGIINEITSK